MKQASSRSSRFLRKILFSLVTALGVIVVLEIAGYLLLLTGWVEGSSPANLANRRRQLLAIEAPEEEARLDVSRAKDFTTLHPFLGKVLDPTSPNLPKPRNPRLQVTQEGFYARDGHLEIPENAFIVAFFGGSVSLNLAMSPLEDLRAELKRVPALKGRPVIFLSRALGSYKQPQQFAALAHCLTRGERFDVIVNLDGFNDLVLPAVANLKAKVSPYYPNDWLANSSGVLSFEARRLTGQVSFVEERRRILAGTFEKPLLARRAIWNVIWTRLDRRLAGRLEALELELRESFGKRRQYRTHGPRRRYQTDEAMFQDLAGFWAESSLQMHRLASANGILYLHFLQPNQYVPGSKPLSPEDRATGWRPDSVHRPVVEASWHRLRELGASLQEQGVPFTDLTEIYRDTEEQVYIDTCCHVNRLGNEILAEAVGSELIRALETDAPHGASHLRSVLD